MRREWRWLGLGTIVTIQKILAASVIGVGLAGCVATTEVMDKLMASQEPPSPAIRKAIVNAARDYLADPYSIRDVEISSVMTTPNPGLQAVCVKFNAKNAVGGYTGRTATAVQLQNGQPIGANQGAPGCSEPRLKYYPFPESDVLRKL